MSWPLSRLFLLPRPIEGDILNAIRDLKSQQIEILKAQAEMLKVILAVNQTLAKLILQKSTEPDELTNAQRAALFGLPESMADLVDWEQIRNRR